MGGRHGWSYITFAMFGFGWVKYDTAFLDRSGTTTTMKTQLWVILQAVQSQCSHQVDEECCSICRVLATHYGTMGVTDLFVGAGSQPGSTAHPKPRGFMMVICFTNLIRQIMVVMFVGPLLFTSYLDAMRYLVCCFLMYWWTVGMFVWFQNLLLILVFTFVRLDKIWRDCVGPTMLLGERNSATW